MCGLGHGINDIDTGKLLDSKNGILAAHRAGIPVILVPDLLEPDDEMKEKAVALKENLHQVIDYINEKNV